MKRFFLSINYVDFILVEDGDEVKGFEYRKDYIPKTTPYNRRPAILLEPTTITIHNTGNPSSTALNERDWLTNSSNTRTASFHIVIDDKEAIEVIPLNEVGWHVGDGSAATSGDRTSIGIEICESGNYDRTLENASLLVANLLKERNWGIERLRRHYDWNGKNCPRLMNADGKWLGWLDFKQKVSTKLHEISDEDVYTHSDEGNGGYMMSEADANKIIKFLSAAYYATNNKEAKLEFNRLANELRKASGQKPSND